MKIIMTSPNINILPPIICPSCGQTKANKCLETYMMQVQFKIIVECLPEDIARNMRLKFFEENGIKLPCCRAQLMDTIFAQISIFLYRYCR